MDKFSRNKQNELSFSIIYNFIVLEEIKQKVNIQDLIESHCELDYDQVDIYIKEVVLKCIKNYEALKELITSKLVKWRYERVSTINKAILMYGLTNGLYMDQLEKKVIIDIAISLSKKFGEDGDYKFINAILDKTI
jgi:N utilization substance protein B